MEPADPTLKQAALEWCREGRNPWVRAPLLLYGLFVLSRIILNDPTRTPLGFLTFGIHELGHIVFMPGGEWIGVAGGSLAQVLAPLFGAWQFLRQRDFFGAAFSLSWLAESLHDLSFYIGDARAMVLPLANLFGGDPIHDWHYLLESVNRLALDQTYAREARAVAFASELTFLWLGGWLVWQMWRAPRRA